MNDSIPISHALRDRTCYLKLRGELRHDLAGPLDALLERLYAAEPAEVDDYVIDLTEACFMDSTMIGLLAGIAREQRNRGRPAPTVFTTHPEIDQLLCSLCLDEVFTLVRHPTDRPLPPAELCVLASSPNGAGDPCADERAAETILRAHEALIELNEANREAFQPVVELFREQLGRP